MKQVTRVLRSGGGVSLADEKGASSNKEAYVNSLEVVLLSLIRSDPDLLPKSDQYPSLTLCFD